MLNTKRKKTLSICQCIIYMMNARSKATLSRYKQQASSYTTKHIHEWINLMQHIRWVYIHSTIFTFLLLILFLELARVFLILFFKAFMILFPTTINWTCLSRVRVFYSLTLRLFEKAQRVKDILVPPKCLLLFQKK